MKTTTRLRIARPTNQLERVVRFYTDGLGWRVLDHFQDHEGIDGVMVGLPGALVHLEFTRRAGDPVDRAPTAEHLLVFYLPEKDEWRASVARMREAGYVAVPASNPYWDREGLTFEDPDGYRVVLENARWSS